MSSSWPKLIRSGGSVPLAARARSAAKTALPRRARQFPAHPSRRCDSAGRRGRSDWTHNRSPWRAMALPPHPHANLAGFEPLEHAVGMVGRPDPEAREPCPVGEPPNQLHGPGCAQQEVAADAPARQGRPGKGNHAVESIAQQQRALGQLCQQPRRQGPLGLPWRPIARSAGCAAPTSSMTAAVIFANAARPEGVTALANESVIWGVLIRLNCVPSGRCRFWRLRRVRLFTC